MKLSKNEKEPTIDQVRAYLLGELSGEEASKFEQRMKSDQAFQREMVLNKALLAGIDRHFDREMKSYLQSLEKDTKRSIGISLPKKILIVSIAASFLIIFGIVGTLRLNSNPSERLFMTYYEPYYNVVNGNTRSEEMETGSYGEAFILYENQAYDLALQRFEILLTSYPDDVPLRYYMGLSQLETNNEIAAIESFRWVTTLSSDFAEPAQWYLALSYLKLDRREECKGVLKKIVASNSSYTKRATAILNELD